MAARIRDQAQIRASLRRHPALHVYELGDLDDFFWPHTTWFARGDAIALLYTPPASSVLIALAPDDECEGLAHLIETILPELPARLHAHVSPSLVATLAGRHRVHGHGAHLKMALVDPTRLQPLAPDVDQLGPDDAVELGAFYARCYPGNWFDPRMLETRQYFAIREGNEMIAAAGIHVYSANERVAALGNIATAPHHRRRGLAAKVTSRLCRSLLQTVELIGLNVKADNHAAIACYAQLGFEPVATYEEVLLERG
ncbi:MAG: GCN5-related N-acetyltransferase [Deltaproteobacteria bacterium]|nr:GCN5-related N-acetyltransferase [Deltaproteobacteria bacterium]